MSLMAIPNVCSVIKLSLTFCLVFIRSAKTLNLLEARRDVKIIDVIIFLQKHWRRTLAQIRFKKMRALMTIIEYYRKYKLRKYISDLEKKFRNVRQMPDKGKSITYEFFKLSFFYRFKLGSSTEVNLKYG